MLPDPDGMHTNLLSFLALVARPRLAPELGMEVARQAPLIQDWTTLLDLAEHHGVGPLLFRHLEAASVEPPRWVKRRLHADLTRQRRANQVRFAALREILDACARAGIQVALLKGAALAPLIYEDIGLRPMNDLDLLVRDDQASEAQCLLAEIGFDAPPPMTGSSRRHHLPVAVRWIHGVPVQIEVHRNAFLPTRHASLQLDRHVPLLPFTIEGRSAQTLAPTELVWHLCVHLTIPGAEFRLISVADIVGTVERFEREVDWPRVRREYPFVLRTLELLDCVVPPYAGRRSQSPAGAHGWLQGFGTRYTGWPAFTARRLPGNRERLRLLRSTVTPPEWWLRLAYGTGTGPAGAWIGRLRHAGFVVESAVRRTGELLAASAPRWFPRRGAMARARRAGRQVR